MASIDLLSFGLMLSSNMWLNLSRKTSEDVPAVGPFSWLRFACVPPWSEMVLDGASFFRKNVSDFLVKIGLFSGSGKMSKLVRTRRAFITSQLTSEKSQ